MLMSCTCFADSVPTEDAELTRLRLERATRIASLVASICSSPGKEAPLWSVDANLRPRAVMEHLCAPLILTVLTGIAGRKTGSSSAAEGASLCR